MRIDSHQHFWRYNSSDYVWMNESMACLQRDFLPSDLQPLLAEIGFDASIAVQARQMLVETQWLLELAERHPTIVGVVGWVDFESNSLDADLERFAADAKFRGVRELIHDMPDLDYALSDSHVRGISRLEKYGLTYDLLLKPPHLRPALELVRKFPAQPFVVDHLAKPDIASGEVSPWREDIERLAECDNVYCKLSGMATEARWGDWQPNDFRPYLDVLVDAFGPQRLMIGSDWPVCTLSGSYREVMRAVISYVEELSTSEREAILGATCAAFYGVGRKPMLVDSTDSAAVPEGLSC